MEILLYPPKQLADRLQVSTTTLRRYEDQDLLPEVMRTASNRRCYTPAHLQAFLAIRALLKGYPIPVVYEAMRKIKHGTATEALWLLNQQQYAIQLEKQRVEAILGMIKQSDFAAVDRKRKSDALSVGEVARIAGVNPSAIRHWEQEGLIHSTRHPENGYRQFTARELKKILVISSLRKTVFFIDSMKQLLHDLDTHNLASIEKSVQIALNKLNGQLARQYQAIAEVMRYMELLDK